MGASTIKSIFLGASLCCALCAAAPAKDAPPAALYSTEVSGGDLLFLTEAARTSALLIRLSNLARSHAVTPEVKDLAAAVETDQTAALAQIKAVAGHKQVPVSGAPDEAGLKLLRHAAEVKGAKFDKMYLDTVAEAQQELGAAFDGGAHSADPEIKAFAAAAQPALKKQAARVRQLSGN